MLMGHISPQAGFCQCPNFAQFLKMGGVQKNELHFLPTLLFGVDVVVGVGGCYYRMIEVGFIFLYSSMKKKSEGFRQFLT